MSTTLRGIIIILCIFIFVVVIAYQSLSHKSAQRRAYTYLMLASILFPFLDLGMTVSGNSIRVFEVATIVFLMFNLSSLFKLAKKYFLIIVYAVILLITSLSSEFKIDSLTCLFEKIVPAIVFLAAIMLFKEMDENNRLKQFAKYMKIPIIMVIFFGLMQIFVSRYFSVFYSVWDKELRISSCFPDPQIAGCSIAILIAYIWNNFLNAKKSISLLLIVILVYLGLQTGSKAFLLGFIISILSSFIFTHRKSKYTIVIIIIGSILIYTQEYWGNLYVFERLNNADASLKYRQEVYWLTAIEMFKNNWVTGIGSGVFQQYIKKYNISLTHYINGEEVYALQPESGYLLWLVELGIFSLIYIIIVFYFLLKKRGNQCINITLIIPWLVAYVSVYNLSSNMLVYILFTILALIVIQTDNKKHV